MPTLQKTNTMEEVTYLFLDVATVCARVCMRVRVCICRQQLYRGLPFPARSVTNLSSKLSRVTKLFCCYIPPLNTTLVAAQRRVFILIEGCHLYSKPEG